MSPPPFKDYSEAVRLYLLGVPIARLARQYGISKQAMWGILKRRGILKKTHKDHTIRRNAKCPEIL